MRVRVLDALQRRSRQFRTRKELWPLRVPGEPLLLDDVLEEALGDEHGAFSTVTLRSKTLLDLRWDDGSRWEAWVIALPSGLKLFCDTDDEEARILASGRRDAEGVDTERFFLELLSESAGEHFGIATSGIAPARVRSALTDRSFLVEVFVALFEVAGTQASVHEALATDGAAGGDTGDFRDDVERWLERVMVP